MNEETRIPKRKRRWIWFLVIVISIPCIWYVYRAERQKSIAHWINTNRGYTFYDYEVDPDGEGLNRKSPPGPAWFSETLGVDYFSSIEVVYSPSKLDDIDLKRTATLNRLRALHLDFLSPSSVSDLTPIADMWKLEILSVGNASVSDLSPLAGLKYLRKLGLSETEVTDLSPLAGLERLEELTLYSNPISDLTPLAGLERLEVLTLWDDQISDLTPLARLERLKVLTLRENQISNLTPLTGLKRLEELTLFPNKLINDLTPLAGLEQIKTIRLDGTNVTDLTPLAGLKNLKELVISNTQVSDEEIKKLQTALPGCRISNFRN